MSESEGFLARWSRLKQRSPHERAAAPEDGSQGALQADQDATPPASPPDVDLTTLPDLASIGPDSDIRPFLQAGVPQELTGAALRSAWVADPAIRDFVEIADNQWDFNAESGIPGFGSLGSSDYAKGLVARALEGLDDAKPELPSNDGEVTSTAHSRTGVPGPAIIDEVWKAGAADAPDSGSNNGDPPPAARAPAAAAGTGQTLKRAHGTALPK
jgi:nucleotide-binding universal stress UspA family protein